mmetsp:Transcript_7602/g.28674  ORF Transcript_7602/g.28674 Transcript_7602/m.28674 type:complete len:228 (-) Transcript_7602:105-788(-)
MKTRVFCWTSGDTTVGGSGTGCTCRSFPRKRWRTRRLAESVRSAFTANLRCRSCNCVEALALSCLNKLWKQSMHCLRASCSSISHVMHNFHKVGSEAGILAALCNTNCLSAASLAFFFLASLRCFRACRHMLDLLAQWRRRRLQTQDVDWRWKLEQSNRVCPRPQSIAWRCNLSLALLAPLLAMHCRAAGSDVVGGLRPPLLLPVLSILESSWKLAWGRCKVQASQA